MRTPRIAAVATLLALSLLTACGDGDDDSDSSDDKTTVTVTETPTETTARPTTHEASVTPMDPTDSDVTQEQVEAALLTPEEVSPDFVLGAYTDESSPPLCDPEGTPVDEAVPPSVQGGTQIDHADGSPRSRRRSRSTPLRPKPPRRSGSRPPASPAARAPSTEIRSRSVPPRT